MAQAAQGSSRSSAPADSCTTAYLLWWDHGPQCLFPHTRVCGNRSLCLTGSAHLGPGGIRVHQDYSKEKQNLKSGCSLQTVAHTQQIHPVTFHLPPQGRAAHMLDQNAMAIPKQPLTSYDMKSSGHSTFGS